MKPKWKAGDLIRNKETGKPFLVLHVYTTICTILADPSVKNSPTIALMPYSYDEFAKDEDMKQTVKKNDEGEYNETWELEPNLYAAL